MTPKSSKYLGLKKLVLHRWKSSAPSQISVIFRSYSTVGIKPNYFGHPFEVRVTPKDSKLIPQELLHHKEFRVIKLQSKIQAPKSLSSIKRTTKQALEDAETWLTSKRFSTSSSMLQVLGPYRDLVVMFLLKNDDVDHPLLHFARDVVGSLRDHQVSNRNGLWKSLVVLLTSEMYGFNSDSSTDEIHIRERHDLVAKIAQVSWTTHELHRKILDVSTLIPLLPYLYPGVTPSGKHAHVADWHRANKTAALIGDLLLTRKCSYLASLRSPSALELLCNSLGNFCESEFELGGVRNFTFEAYLNRTELALGSLLGHCLYTCLMFSGHSTQVAQEAFVLGSKIGILLQICLDLEFFSRESLQDPRWMDPGLLPVVLKLRTHDELRFKPHPEMFEIVKSDPRAIAEATQIFESVRSNVLCTLTDVTQVRNTSAFSILWNFVASLNPRV